MSIKIIKPSIGPDPTSLTHTSESFLFSGLTTQGDSFLHDLIDDTWFIFDPTTGGTGGAYVEIDKTLEELKTSSQRYQIQVFYNNVQTLISDTVRSYNYDSSDNFISYYNSGVTAWRNEAIAFNTWRDNTETLMYDNIFSFTADGITLPDLAGFTGQTGYFDVGITASRPNLFS